MKMAIAEVLAAAQVGAQAATQSGGLLTDSLSGNVLIAGISVVGLLAATVLLGTSHMIRAEQRDPLNRRHILDV